MFKLIDSIGESRAFRRLAVLLAVFMGCICAWDVVRSPHAEAQAQLSTGVFLQPAQSSATIVNTFKDNTHATETTAAIQAAINAAQATGGTRSVYLPPGDYSINPNVILITKAIEFYGGPGTRLMCNGASTGYWIQYLSNNGNVSDFDNVQMFVRGPYFHDFEMHWTSGTSATAGAGLYATDQATMSYQGTVQNVIFDGFWEGLKLVNCGTWTMRHDQFFKCPKSSLAISEPYDGDQGACRILDCIFWGFGTFTKATDITHIRLGPGSAHIIGGNQITSYANGIFIDLESTNVSAPSLVSQGHLIFDNFFDGSGIYCYSDWGRSGAAGTLITNNCMKRMQINNNHFYGESTKYALNVDCKSRNGDAGFEDLMFSNNQAYDSAGVLVADYGRLHIMGNQLRGPGSGQSLTCSNPSDAVINNFGNYNYAFPNADSVAQNLLWNSSSGAINIIGKLGVGDTVFAPTDPIHIQEANSTTAAGIFLEQAGSNGHKYRMQSLSNANGADAGKLEIGDFTQGVIIGHFNAGKVELDSLPTSDPHVAGMLWNSSGTVHVSAG